MKAVRAALLLSSFAVAAQSTFAAESEDTTLKVGDSAPPLQVSKWIQGDPVKKFDPGKAYIVEFWATWCGPCRVSIPHLNEIHDKYKDKGLIVIGQDCWERNQDDAAKFVKKMGDQMTYRVALDVDECGRPERHPRCVFSRHERPRRLDRTSNVAEGKRNRASVGWLI
jgi:thiol-disulfide isomerase/thioredoxin